MNVTGRMQIQIKILNYFRNTGKNNLVKIING
jgi:hypothetical protein